MSMSTNSDRKLSRGSVPFYEKMLLVSVLAVSVLSQARLFHELMTAIIP
jgi:hypothetical protein